MASTAPARSLPPIHPLDGDCTVTPDARLALWFLAAIAVMAASAGTMAVVLRLELMTARADLLSADTFNRLFTAHGMTMVWFVGIVAIPATLGNALLPGMIHARGSAFPNLARMAFALYATAAVLMLTLSAFGGIDTGWTLLSSSATLSPARTIATVGALLMSCAAVLLIAIHQLVTIHTMRPEGTTWMGQRVFVWTSSLFSAMAVLATPLLAFVLLTLALSANTAAPAPWLASLFTSNFFWSYGGIATYMLALPAIGVMSEIISDACGRRLAGQRALCFSLIAIAVLSFTIGGRHAQASGGFTAIALWSSFASYLIAVPFCVVLGSWVVTLRRSSVSITPSLAWVIASVGLILIGGATGLMLSNLAIDRHLHSTYFVTGHFHLLATGILMAFVGGLFHWWRRLSGRMASPALGYAAAATVFIGGIFTYLPYFFLGMAGLPRRFSEYPPEYQSAQVLSTAGVPILIAGYAIAVVALLRSTPAPPSLDEAENRIGTDGQ